MKLISINEKSKISYEEKPTTKILVDGKDYSEALIDDSIQVVKKVAALFENYKEKAQKTGFSTFFQAHNASLIVREVMDFEKEKKAISSEKIKERFSFLEKSPYFYHKFEKDSFYYYQFKANESLGEVQYIYIKIPSLADHHFHANFKVVKNGIAKRFSKNEHPFWFKNLYNQAKDETKKMLKLRRIFLSKKG